MPTNARRRHRIGTGGPWGSGLLLLGTGAIAQGVGYATRSRESLPDAIDYIGQTIPMWVWGAVWVAAGIYSVWKALNPPQQHIDVWAMVAVTSIWSASYFAEWIFLALRGEFTTDWSSGVGWAMLAGVISCLGRCVNPLTMDRDP